ESQLFLQDCIKQLNNEKLDFVIFGGDQVETPGMDDTNWQLFVDCAQVLSCPWSFVLGEKDVSGNPPVDKMKLYGPDWKQKGIQTDKPYWSQSPLPGVHIIGMDTSRAESTTGDISNEQLEWLKRDLEKNAGKFTIVFSHHPLLAPPPFDAGPPWDDYIIPNGASAREILGGSKDVHLAISGHLHVNKVQQESNIWYVSTASLDVYPCSFRIFRITPQTIQVESYQISFPALVKKARQQLDSSTLAFKYNEQRPTAFADLAFGSRIDNNALLPLAPGQPAQLIDEKKLKKAKEEQSKKEQATEEKDKGKKKKGEDKKAEPKEKKEGAKDKKEDSKETQEEPKKGKKKGDKKKPEPESAQKDKSDQSDKTPSEKAEPSSRESSDQLNSDVEMKPSDQTPALDTKSDAEKTLEREKSEKAPDTETKKAPKTKSEKVKKTKPTESDSKELPETAPGVNQSKEAIPPKSEEKSESSPPAN
ncbi:MAG: metallophosphoesterase, partial [Candidatus Melainabacteria bacterium]|nr:metallophosphoesterase [Candidatus Melainabacteria bacterium]